jgi:hypothetical protein
VAAIGVAKTLDPVHSENACTRTQFVQPQTTVLIVHAPVGCRDDNYAVPGCHRPSEGATGEDHLVVRMGMECDDGGHRMQYARRRARPDRRWRGALSIFFAPPLISAQGPPGKNEP